MMASSHKQYSLIKRISQRLTIIYVVLLCILFLNNLLTFQYLYQNIFNQLSDSLAAGNRQITSELNNTRTYLSTLPMNSSNILIVERNSGDSNYYSALHNLQSELSSGLSSLSLMEGLFVFPTTSRQFIYVTASSHYNSVASSLRRWCRSSQDDGTLSGHVSKYWFSYECNDQYYLVCLLRSGSSYIGAWTSYERLLSRIDPPVSLDASPYYTDNDTATYDDDSHRANFILHAPQNGKTAQHVKLDGNYLAVSIPVSYTETGYLYLLISYSIIIRQLAKNYMFSILSITIFLLLAITGIRRTIQSLKAPIRNLEHSINALQNGDFNTRLHENDGSIEFNHVNHAFNEMASQIEELKISVYEKRLAEQRMQLQALKNQIAPHFLINCLNSIYYLSMERDLEPLRQMTVHLGEHLRYALADVTVVPLKTELHEVENYVELSRLRYPDCIMLFTDIAPDIADASVPPMILLFQVENIIKYEVIMGQITEIHIEARREAYDDHRLHLAIWDTGTGYSINVLQQLADPEQLSQSDGHNIGTRNIFMRLNLMFGTDFSMSFSNREHAGAQVDIHIPFQEIHMNEGGCTQL